MSVSTKVSNRINRMKRGIPFPISGFYTLGNRTSVQKAMSRLTQKGAIKRVSKGFYVRPKPLASIPSITVTASAEQVAQAWAKEYGYKLVRQGQEAAYRLGLQTQAPVKTIFWSNGPSRQFKIGNEVVEVRHITEQKLRWAGRPEGTLLRGLIVTPLESVEFSNLFNAVKRLSLSNEEAKAAVQKLSAAPLLQGWQPKLQQFERMLA
ncbi:MAG: DUF6088 family protein [Pseudomonadales bacterium]